MSTLRTTNLQHPSAASPNMVLASDGKTTFGGAVVGAGMDLIATSEFSAVSLVSVNNCFTSTYQNYRININCEASVAALFLMRMRASGTDAAGANYNYAYVLGDGAGVRAARVNNNSSALLGDLQNAAHQITLEVFNPALAYPTAFNSAFNSGFNSTAIYVESFFAGHAVSNSYDGFTIYPNTGNITGTIRVYGYKNS
jgi:hypothetical protein